MSNEQTLTLPEQKHKTPQGEDCPAREFSLCDSDKAAGKDCYQCVLCEAIIRSPE